MPKFSTRSKSKLHTCHKDLVNLFNEVVKHFDNVLREHYEKYGKNKSKMTLEDIDKLLGLK